MRQIRRDREVIAVIIRQYGTGLYRSYVSLGPDNSTCLGTHPDEIGATEKLNRFWAAYDEGMIRTAGDLTLLIETPSNSHGVVEAPPATIFGD